MLCLTHQTTRSFLKMEDRTCHSFVQNHPEACHLRQIVGKSLQWLSASSYSGPLCHTHYPSQYLSLPSVHSTSAFYIPTALNSWLFFKFQSQGLCFLCLQEPSCFSQIFTSSKIIFSERPFIITLFKITFFLSCAYRSVWPVPFFKQVKLNPTCLIAS